MKVDRWRRRWSPGLRRKVALVLVAPIVIGLLFGGGEMIRASIVARQGVNAYTTNDPGTAELRFESLLRPNHFDQWRAHYNHGTALVRMSILLFPQAAEALTKAYDLAPDDEARCLAQTNLAITWEAVGDVVRPKNPAEASDAFAEAIVVREWPGCPDTDRTPEEEQAEKSILEDLAAKKEAAQEAADKLEQEQANSKDSDGDSTEPGNQQTPAPSAQEQAAKDEQERRERLEQQNRQGQEDGDEERARSDYVDGKGDQQGDRGSTKRW